MSATSSMAGITPTQTGWMRHLPNLITVLRMLLVVPLIVAIVQEHYAIALGVALVAGVSDGVDGYLARHYGWQSRLGSILDPAADKLMLVSSMLVLGWLGEAPRWLVVLVVARDAVIALGVLAWQYALRGFEARPSWLSKATTVAQIGFVLLVLADQAFGWGMPLVAPAWIVAMLTAASGIDYVVRWGRLARNELKRAKGRS